MAVDATARLYDVDEDSVVFKKLDRSKKYDQGVLTFRARKGKLIDLDKLHESIWATRLSGGTRSGLVSLEVVAVGKLVKTQDGAVLRVDGSKREFLLGKSPDKRFANGNDLVRELERLKKSGRSGRPAPRAWATEAVKGRPKE